MSETRKYLYAKEQGALQIPYRDYLELMEKVRQGQRIKEVRAAVLEDLSRFLEGKDFVPADTSLQASENDIQDVQDGLVEEAAVEAEVVETTENVVDGKQDAVTEDAEDDVAETPVAMEAEESEDVEEEPVVAAEEPVAENIVPPEAEKVDEPVAASPVAADEPVRKIVTPENIPAIKSDIENHFNKVDGSGRLLNIFKQYYTCLNASCGGTVRVTLKDGVCSFWNYDAWEEFSFVDVFEGQLRIAVGPEYADEVKSLHLCEVSRLVANRRDVICVKVDGLNQIMLGVMEKAFAAVEITAG